MKPIPLANNHRLAVDTDATVSDRSPGPGFHGQRATVTGASCPFFMQPDTSENGSGTSSGPADLLPRVTVPSQPLRQPPFFDIAVVEAIGPIFFNRPAVAVASRSL